MGDSEFDQEVWRNLAEKINNSKTQTDIEYNKEPVPIELKGAKKLLGEKLALRELLRKSGFFPSNKVEAFVSMTQYGIVRFYFAFTILYCMNRKTAGISNEQLEYLCNRLLDYFGMNLFELDSLKLSNFGSSRRDGGLVFDKKSKFDSYVDVCVETLVDFMNDYLCLDRDFIEKQKKKLTSSIFFLNGENNMADDNVVLFQIFEENLSNLLNANAICLANKIPIASVGNAGAILAFSTNKFLESYRRELLRLFNTMTHIDQARLRRMIGSNSFLKLLNRFPLRADY